MSNPVPLPEQQSRSWVRPTTSARRTAGRSFAGEGFPAPIRTDTGTAAAPAAGQRTLRWDDLDPIEQSLLAVASREHTLERACGSWAQRPRRPIAMEMTKHAAVMLFDNGLIGFYRVDVGYPDLGEVAARMVLADQTHWDCEHPNARQVGLFLTTAGEDVVLGP